MRILVAIEHLGPFGGAQRSTLELAEALSRRGHEFIVVYRVADAFTPRWKVITSDLIQAPLWTSPRHPVSTILGSVRSARLLVDTKPEVVFCTFFATLPFSLLAGRKTEVPVVMSVREPVVEGVRRPFYRMLLRKTTSNTFVSARLKDLYQQDHMAGRDPTVVYTGLDTNQYRPPTQDERVQAREELDISTDQIVVLYMGRLDPVKGIETLMEATGRVNDRRLAVLVAGGPSVWRAGGERYAAQLRAAAPSGVRFLGSRDDVRDLIWAADVVVVPSLWEEPLSRVPLEAMACGVPVVASRVGGSPEMFKGELSELLFRPGDADDLIAALRRALPELGSTRRWNDLSRANVVENFKLDTAAASLESVLSRAIS
jgi:glycosyltransferase involved in cell wall biosynthesis